jgi:hypothetical protein
MEKDFSVEGREKFLAKTFYASPSIDTNWEFAFARWTLLERVIWQFMPDDTYCYLDGYDLDEIDRFDDGFVGIGRVWHLPESGTPGDIPAVIAVEFSPASSDLYKAVVWVGRTSSDNGNEPKLEAPSLATISILKHRIGAGWQRAFFRDAEGWSLDCDFDLSIFLMARKGE